MSTEIKVPDIGDFKEVEIIEILVNEGQKISKNDPLITLESDKSSVEVPSTENGTIKKNQCQNWRQGFKGKRHRSARRRRESRYTR